MLMAAMTVSAQSCVAPPPGLVSWWQGQGSAVDFSGTNNGTLLNGATYGPGEVGQGFSLSGNLQAVDVGYATNLQLQNFTIEAWIKRSSSSVVTLDSSFGGDALFFGYGVHGYGFSIYRDNRLLLTQIGIGGVWSSGTVADTNYHHVAVTKNNASVVFYIDGVNAGVASYDPGFSFTNHANIGAAGDFQEDGFYGVIDEMAIYNRALSATEIQGIYAAGSAGKMRNRHDSDTTDQRNRVYRRHEHIRGVCRRKSAINLSMVVQWQRHCECHERAFDDQ